MNSIVFNTRVNYSAVHFSDVFAVYLDGLMGFIYRLSDGDGDDYTTRAKYHTIHHDYDEFMYVWTIPYDSHLEIQMTITERCQSPEDCVPQEGEIEILFEVLLDGEKKMGTDGVLCGLTLAEYDHYGDDLCEIEQYIRYNCNELRQRLEYYEDLREEEMEEIRMDNMVSKHSGRW